MAPFGYGGRLPYDPVVRFKALAAMHSLSDEPMEFLIRDRLSWLRFLAFQQGEATPIWRFLERLPRAGSFKPRLPRFKTSCRIRLTSRRAARLLTLPDSYTTPAADDVRLKAQSYRLHIHPRHPSTQDTQDTQDTRGKPIAKDIPRGKGDPFGHPRPYQVLLGPNHGPRFGSLSRFMDQTNLRRDR